MEPPRLEEQLHGQEFIELTSKRWENFYVNGTMQILDDCAEGLTFSKANIYSAERVTSGKERIYHHIVLPYHMVQASRSYSWYRRIAPDDGGEGKE